MTKGLRKEGVGRVSSKKPLTPAPSPRMSEEARVPEVGAEAEGCAPLAK